MAVRDDVLEGAVHPLSGKIFLQLTTPHVSSMLELPAHFGGSDAVVLAAPEDSVLRRDDTVLVDRYGMVFPFGEPHDAGAIIMCHESAILCWTLGDIGDAGDAGDNIHQVTENIALIPFPNWLLCKHIPVVVGKFSPSWNIIKLESRDEVECLKVILDGNDPTTHLSIISPDTYRNQADRTTKSGTRRVLVPRVAGFDIVYYSRRWRLVSHEDCLAEYFDT